MMPLGGLVSVIAAYFLYNSGIGAPLIWRVIFALGAVPAVIVIILRSWLPESPRWLSKFGNSLKSSKEFRLSTPNTRRHNYSVLAGKYKRALIYSSVAWFSAGTTSIFTIFSPIILEKFALKGYPQMILLTATIWVAATCGAAFAIALHDTVGRKNLLGSSMVLLGLSDLLLGITFTSKGYVIEAALAGAMFFSFMNISAAYVIQTEVFPTEIKGFADGITFTINRLANFAFGILVPVLLELNIIRQFMWFTGIVVISMIVIVMITGIETMGKGLEKIQQEVVLS